jgi:hypothetical protein
MKLIAFPNNLPSTPKPRTRKTAKVKALQTTYDALRDNNPSLSLEAFLQVLDVTQNKSAMSQVEQMINESRKINGVPVAEQMHSALTDYVIGTLGVIV